MTRIGSRAAKGIDAPRDKRTYFREINYIAAAFQYQKKNYNSA
ncbi:glucosamine-6-phosphate deaminase [Salmonella enterica]|nr:glucosamine-6-phosphate deaminase [Salmonella enterica subsp. enterica serovar Agona]